MTKKIKQSGDGNYAFQDTDIYVTVSIFDEIDRLTEQGDYNEVANLIRKVKDFVGIKHPFYPHYRYKPVQIGNTTVFEHEPLTEVAVEKYPLSIRGIINIPSKHLEGSNDIHKLIEDAYFKQEEIEINMSSLTTWLGDYLVETPNLDDSLKEGKWVIVPNPLPDPLRLKFYIKGTSEVSLIDYLEMTISGKDGNEFILLDNNRQENSKLLITLKLPINGDFKKEFYKSTKAKFNMKIKTGFQSNVEANRSLLYIFKLVTEGNKTIAFKNLQGDKDLIVVPSFGFEGNIVDLDKDYNFIDRLHKIENHYNLTFTLPEKINKNEWEAIEILEHAMKNKPIKKHLKKLTADLDDKKTVQNIIEIFDSAGAVKKFLIERTGPEARIELFDEIIQIEKEKVIYNSLKIDDLDRLKSKLEFMDEGESIKITFTPGDDPEFNEHYYLKNKNVSDT
jgi:hypothetical protein